MYKIILAPMEGVLDFGLRQALCGVGGFDWTTTEFLRVSNTLYNNNMFYRICPELKNNGRTKDGTPVMFQLLGSDPILMAENAQKAVELGALHIDLNFGCPAKSVNNSGGGAEMLKRPDHIFSVVESVRNAVPKHINVSGKMRLGFDDDSLFIENGRALNDGGASHITLHARTKAQAYRGNADWEQLVNLRPFVNCDLYINGDISSKETAKKAIQLSEADGIMIGRASLIYGNLAKVINNNEKPYEWDDMVRLIKQYINIPVTKESKLQSGKFYPARIKQWFSNYLRKQYPQAENIFKDIKKLEDQKFLNEISKL